MFGYFLFKSVLKDDQICNLYEIFSLFKLNECSVKTEPYECVFVCIEPKLNLFTKERNLDETKREESA